MKRASPSVLEFLDPPDVCLLCKEKSQWKAFWKYDLCDLHMKMVEEEASWRRDNPKEWLLEQFKRDWPHTFEKQELLNE